MSKCKNCDGRGFNLLMDRFGTMRKVGCVECYGTGEVKKSTEQTNEEWFAGLSTEDKADVLNEFVLGAYYAGLDGKIPKMHCCKDFQRWLKAVHKE